MTTDEKKIEILDDLLSDFSLTDSWEQLFDLDDIAEAIDNNDLEKVRKYFDLFLDSIGLDDQGFESYDYICKNIYKLKLENIG